MSAKSLLFNTLSRFVIAFLPRSKRLLVSWLQSPSAVILEPKKYPYPQITTVLTSITTCFTCSGTSTSQNYTAYSLLSVPFTEHCACEARLNTRAFQSRATQVQNEKYTIYLSKAPDGRVLKHDEFFHSSSFKKGYRFHFLYQENINNNSFPLQDL